MRTFGIMIAKLSVVNTWSSITKAKFQNSYVLSFFFRITFLSLLILSNDNKLNPGPKKESTRHNFLVAHWYWRSKYFQINSVKSLQCIVWLWSYLFAWDMVRLYNFHILQWFVSKGLLTSCWQIWQC